MNETENTTTTAQEAPTSLSIKKRGRPKVNVNWPNENFTFNTLVSDNQSLSSSSLRKKMRAELVRGGLLKVGTLKTAFGRPQNIYQKPQ